MNWKTLEWREGQDAYAMGNTTSTCPYRVDGSEPDADKYDEWLNGYQDAADADE